MFKTDKKEKATDPLLRIQAWCAYQERSSFETRRKLKSFGLSAESIELAIAKLISDNFLNEERFSKAYVAGKFKIKKWGLQKIKLGLMRHQVSDYNLQKALSQVDTSIYEAELGTILLKKLATLTKAEHPLQKKQKLYRFALSKGYESHYIEKILNTLNV